MNPYNVGPGMCVKCAGCGITVHVPCGVEGRLAECECPQCQKGLLHGQQFYLVPVVEPVQMWTPEDIDLLKGMKIGVA